MKVDNAVIMAAGTSSRFAPLSYERHKGMVEVKGEILIERQIRQLQAAGVPKIYLITGYKAEQFGYLKEKYGIHLIHNPDYLKRNNHGSIWCARDVIRNTYICSADNYFTINPFEVEVDASYYAAVYADGETAEWCMTEDKNGFIDSVTIGGHDAWYMLGHAFWSEEFSKRFLSILEREYELPDTVDKLWEKIFMEHTDELKMKIRHYSSNFIFEFDTLDELRTFDVSYIADTRSSILKEIAERLDVMESDITNVVRHKGTTNEADGFSFYCNGTEFLYQYKTKELLKKKFHTNW